MLVILMVDVIVVTIDGGGGGPYLIQLDSYIDIKHMPDNVFLDTHVEAAVVCCLLFLLLMMLLLLDIVDVGHG